MNRKEIPAEHEDQAGNQSPCNLYLQISQKKVSKYSPQKEVQDDDGIKGPVKGQQEK